jgi:hypothetical protein
MNTIRMKEQLGQVATMKTTPSPKTPTQKTTTTTPTLKTHSTLLMIMMMTKQMMLEPNKMTPNLLSECDLAMDWNSTDDRRTFKVYFIAMSQPDIGCLHDTLSYYSGFKPGFGKWFDSQTKLAQFSYFPGCISAIIACPIGLIRPLRQYISKTPYLGR